MTIITRVIPYDLLWSTLGGLALSGSLGLIGWVFYLVLTGDLEGEDPTSD